jgi:RHS repeat-associated protein
VFQSIYCKTIYINKHHRSNNSASHDSFSNATGNLSTRYGYTGREFDADLGLQYSRARWYDATLGRFISEDPIGFAGGDVNLYGYVHSNSVNKTDALGLLDPSIYQDPNMYNDPTDQPYNRFEETYNKAAPIENKCSCEIGNPEISNIKQVFKDAVNDMTNQDQRLNSGALNNLISSFQMIRNRSFAPTNRYLGCGEQSEELNRRLRDKIGNNYKLETRDGYYYGFYHQYSVAKSPNPNDPVLILDPWTGNFETRR